MIRLLLDQGLPRSAAAILAARGVDARHVGDLGQHRASDAEIVRLAREQGRAIVTLDADFHRILALSGAATPSVIRIRREGLRGPEAAALIEQVIGQIDEQLQRGAVATVTERDLRLRQLPLPKVASRGPS